jgi:hypothetical protein
MNRIRCWLRPCLRNADLAWLGRADWMIYAVKRRPHIPSAFSMLTIMSSFLVVSMLTTMSSFVVVVSMLTDFVLDPVDDDLGDLVALILPKHHVAVAANPKLGQEDIGRIASFCPNHVDQFLTD